MIFFFSRPHFCFIFIFFFENFETYREFLSRTGLYRELLFIENMIVENMSFVENITCRDHVLSKTYICREHVCDRLGYWVLDNVLENQVHIENFLYKKFRFFRWRFPVPMSFPMSFTNSDHVFDPKYWPPFIFHGDGTKVKKNDISVNKDLLTRDRKISFW